MGQELLAERFFDTTSIGLTYYSVQIAIERLLAANVLRGDLSRILFTSNSFVFRARLEQQDKSSTYEGASSLNFPFANYWYDGYWERDERPAVNNTHQILFGVGDGTYKIRSRPVQAKLNFTFYFNTDAEARLAYENIQWIFLPRSAMMITNVKYKDTFIDVPIIADLDSISYNPEFTEKEWLTQNRIIPITATILVKTYVLGPNKQTPVTSVHSTFKDDELEYITEQSMLYFMAEKGLLNSDASNAVLDIVVSAYFNPQYDVTINSITSSNITYNSARINWDLSIPNLSASDSLESIIVSIQGQPINVINTPTLVSHVDITGLSELSTYKANVYINLKSGKVKAQQITFTTSKDPATASVPGLASISSLKGTTF